MGKAGVSLKQVLEKHDISQYRLAKELGVERTTVYRWVHETRDPTAETLRDIVKALRTIKPEAAEEFAQLFWGDVLQGDD
jgi:transcriptional regulator with XRE-family HTH domain